MLRPSQCAAIVTAAGASSRMGRPKALLAWRGRPLIAHQAVTLADFADVVCVLGADADRIAGAVPADTPARAVHNPRWAEGRSTTIAVGANALAETAARAVLVVAVDQPLSRPVVDALLAAFDPDTDAVAQPTQGGRRGHPILLGAGLLTALSRATERPEGLRDVVRDARTRERLVPVAGAAIHHDLNTEAAYHAAREAAE